MRKIGTFLIGAADRFPFEHRMFNFAVFLGILMTIFGALMDRYYRASILMDLLFAGCWAVTYYLSRVRGYFKVVSVVSFCVFVGVFFPYNWIFSGGSASILPYYAILFIAIVSIILTGRFRMMMVLAMLAVTLLLICGDARNIHAVNNMNWFDFSLQLGVIMIGMAVLIIVYSNTYMKEKARSEAYARTIEAQYRQQSYYMENLERLIYQLKAERHDFNHHLGVIYGLLECREIDDVRDYTKKLVNAAAAFHSIVNLPHYPIVRAMLNYKLSAVKEKQIPLKINVNLPGELKLNQFDLTVVLGNLLDNAMEACAMVEEKNRYIDLNIRYQPDYLVARIENPLSEEPVFPEGKNPTTKKDAANHGFGLKNIEYLVNKHHGLLKIERENGAYVVNVALLID